jgi:hypothetical protein
LEGMDGQFHGNGFTYGSCFFRGVLLLETIRESFLPAGDDS